MKYDEIRQTVVLYGLCSVAFPEHEPFKLNVFSLRTLFFIFWFRTVAISDNASISIPNWPFSTVDSNGIKSFHQKTCNGPYRMPYGVWQLSGFFKLSFWCGYRMMTRFLWHRRKFFKVASISNTVAIFSNSVCQ